MSRHLLSTAGDLFRKRLLRDAERDVLGVADVRV